MGTVVGNSCSEATEGGFVESLEPGLTCFPMSDQNGEDEEKSWGRKGGEWLLRFSISKASRARELHVA